jgi:hypothetical protein
MRAFDSILAVKIAYAKSVGVNMKRCLENHLPHIFTQSTVSFSV